MFPSGGGNNAYVFVWNIENFSHCMYNQTPEFFSPIFSINQLHGILWHLSVRPPCELADNFEISIRRTDLGNDISSMKCEISILALDGSIFFNEKMTLEGDGRVKVPNSDELMQRKCLLLPADTLTIRCRLSQTENVVGSVYIVAYSRIAVDTRTAIRVVEKVSSLSLEETISCPVVSTLGNRHGVLKAEIYLEGPTLSDSCLRARVVMKSMVDRKYVTTQISIMDGNSTKVLKSVKEGQWVEYNNTYAFCHIISRQELLQRQDLLKNDVLYLLFKFTICHGIQCQFIESTFYEPTTFPLCSMQDRRARPICQCDSPCEYHCINNQKTSAPFRTLLQKDFQHLYKDKIHADWELRTGSTSFPVHKCVLCARSPVFRAMFDSNMVETSADFLNIPDIESDTVDSLLLFLYTDAIDDDLGWEAIAKLYYAADKYEVLSLKQKCSSYLIACLCVSNVCDILLLADRHNDEILKSSVHDFIFKNEKKFIQSDEWIKFMNVKGQMATKIMQEVDKRRHRVK